MLRLSRRHEVANRAKGHGRVSMRLYLVQHAEAKSKDEDPQRPLTSAGTENAGRVAALAAGHLNVEISQIFHSGKARAEQTAEIFSKHLKPTQGVTGTDGLGPDDDPVAWLGRVGETSGDLMLVGHLPHLARLCGLLLCGDPGRSPVRFVNGGIVCIERDDEGSWGLAGMVTPACMK